MVVVSLWPLRVELRKLTPHVGTELPSPPAGVSLTRIVLGFGIQNYTCTDVNSDPSAIGALAMLYDITDLYPGKSRRSLKAREWVKLSSKALNSHDVPLTMIPGGIGADSDHPFPKNAALKLSGMASIPFVGDHFFNSNGTPTFHIGRDVFFGKKLAAVNAPTCADAGPDGTGAVPWLYLGDAGSSVGVKYVYRVFTAGGNSHGCDVVEAGDDSTSYATMYWFYG